MNECIAITPTQSAAASLCSRHPQEFACSFIQTSCLRSLFMGKQAPISYFGITRNPAWLEDSHNKGTCFLPFSILLLSPLAPWKQQCMSPRVTTCHPSQEEAACTNTIEEKYWVIPHAWMLQIWKEMFHHHVGQRSPRSWIQMIRWIGKGNRGFHNTWFYWMFRLAVNLQVPVCLELPGYESKK